MTKKDKTKKEKLNVKSKDDKKLFAFLATFLSIIGFIISLIAKREDKYVMFYAKQSLVLFIVMVIGGIIASLLMILPIIGGIIYWSIEIALCILWIISWIYALSGEEKEVPFVGKYAEKINL
jgi:uncharacterized membrane protein